MTDPATPTPTDLPEALRLADELDGYTPMDPGVWPCREAAAELRRLHAALSAAAPAAPAQQYVQVLPRRPRIPTDFLPKLPVDQQLHAGKKFGDGGSLWHTDSDGKFWCGQWHHRTPRELEAECLSILHDLWGLAGIDAPQAQQPTAPQEGAPADDEDGAAFRKAARLGLTLRFYGNCAQSGMPGSPSAYEVTPGEDRVAAMREAVKRAAAVIESGGEAQRLEQSPQAGAESYPPSRDQIRDVFLAHGFTVKEGQTDLKEYVYDAAYALLALRARGAVPSERTEELLRNLAFAVTEKNDDTNDFAFSRASLQCNINRIANYVATGDHDYLMADSNIASGWGAAAPAAVSAPSVGDALAPLRAWWGFLEAQWELCGETPADDVIILHFMGSGASTAVTAGQLRAALSNTASPQAPAGKQDGGAS